MSALMSNRVVMGKKKRKPGRSMTMSPGSLNSGRRRTQGQVRPRRTRLAPSATRIRFTFPARAVPVRPPSRGRSPLSAALVPETQGVGFFLRVETGAQLRLALCGQCLEPGERCAHRLR